MSVRGQVVHTDEFGVTRVLSDDEAREYGAFDNNGLASDNGISSQKRSFVSSLNPVSPVLPNGFKVAGTVLIKMLSALSSPAVIWAILASSISLGKSPLRHICPQKMNITDHTKALVFP